jgi:Flp pilus assembly protein TadB
VTWLVAGLLTAAVLLWPGTGRRLPAVPLRAAVGQTVPDAPGGAGATVVDLAHTVHLLALAVRSGVGLVEAVDAVAAQTPGVLGHQLRTVTAALRWGVDEQTAWRRVPNAWQPVARALRLAGAAGIPPGELLLRAAEDLHRADRQRLQVSAARLGVRVVLPLGLAFLPAFVLTTVVPVVLAIARDVLGAQ